MQNGEALERQALEAKPAPIGQVGQRGTFKQSRSGKGGPQRLPPSGHGTNDGDGSLM